MYREKNKIVGTTAINFLQGQGMWLQRAIFWKVTSTCSFCNIRHIKSDIKMMLNPDWGSK